MNRLLTPAITCAMLMACGSPAFAATVFTNADGANSFITNAANWDNGLPVGQQGTIAQNAGYDSGAGALVNYDILQTDGTFSRNAGLGALSLDDSSWDMNGASASFGASVRGMLLSNSAAFTLNEGTYNQENNRDVTVQTGSSITVNGGAFNAGRSIRLNNGTFTISGGTASTTGTFGQGGFITQAGTINLNGGTLTGSRFVFQVNGTVANIGGTAAGSASFADWGTGNGAGSSGDRQDDRRIQINFLSGTQMALTMESTARELDFDDDGTGDAGAAWAEALWSTDRLLFDGQSSTDLGGLSWADATNPGVGLGGGNYFEFTEAGSFGGTLSLVVPEPSSLALLAIGGLCIMRRRRSHA